MNGNNNSKVFNGDKNGQGVHQIKLISVNFKEAALDSPSFRANVNHLDNQTDNLEEWLLALSKSLMKLSTKLEEIRQFSNSFLENLVPRFLQDGLIDQEYTSAALRVTLESTEQKWDKNLRELKINLPPIDSINKIILKYIGQYRETRKRFESAQEKYDKYLRIFLSTPKAKHPSMILEDSQQLYSVRKAYLHESLQLVIELTNLGNLIDKNLIKLTHDIWKQKKSNFNENDYEAMDSWKIIQNIKIWSETYNVSLTKIKPDMLAARNQVEESSFLQFAPSSNLNDYTCSMINAKTLAMSDETSIEKHGYLFMKTSGKKSKPAWVKRWVFIKNGVFGLLVLSPSKTFVQETDKIGILLCNVKYASNEDRRFCFEVKTIDQTIIFQAETLDDLKSWLKVFENERTRVFQEAKEDPSKKIIASGRYPPMITELASTIATTIDKELTNTMISDSSTGHLIASSSLSSHIETNEKAFEKIYSEIPQMKPPFMTSTTKSSILAYSIVSPTSVPTALTANIWGSVNWGLYHLHEVSNGDDNSASESEEEIFIENCEYPSYYPLDWISTDIEMRALFETAIGQNEVCLFSFRCLWSPNSKQELNGKCYITTKHIYFYLQALGFSSLNKFPLSGIFSVDYSSQSNFDYLKLYNMSGVIKLKLYLDNGQLIKQKFSYLINNNTKEKPVKLAEIIRDLKKIERDLEYENRNSLKLEKSISRNGDVTRRHSSASNSFLPNENGNKELSFKINFNDEGKLFFVKKYPIPPKALFHALLGENSVMLKTNDLFLQFDSVVKKPWTINGDNYPKRSLIIPISYRGRSRGKIRIEQNIFNYSNNDEYFTFTLKKSRVKFFIGSSFSIHQRFVVVGIAGKNSEVHAYCNIIFDNWSIFNPLLARICISFGKYYFYNLNSSLNEVVQQVGKHGVVAKAIYLYGKLGFTNEQESEIEEPTLNLYFKDIAFLIIEKSVLRYYGIFIRFFTFWMKSFVKLIVSLKMNQFLVFIIFVSGAFNIFLSTKATSSYWTIRKANQTAQQYVNSQPNMLVKGLYLQDVKEMTQNKFSSNSVNTTEDSRCFNMFKDVSFVLNNNKLFWNNEYGDEETRVVARNLMKTYQEIAVKRNKILIKLNMLNRLEEEIGKGEWINWLSSELNKCSYIKHNLLNESKQNSLDNNTLDDIMAYCDSCYNEQARISLI